MGFSHEEKYEVFTVSNSFVW